jgi:tRNA pseudouridine55 synthase
VKDVAPSADTGRGRARREGSRRCLPVDGVLLLDKPLGLTSNQALQASKRLLNACKAGHTGGLDPIATGLLPLCFGEATKVSRFLLDADKRYWTVFRLGQATTTFDREGEVTLTHPVDADKRQVEQALRAFVGEIEQLPPMYSAVKRGGKALYKYARAGVEVARSPRPVRVHAIRLIDLAGERLELEIDCSKGTCIRALAHDLGQALGCGAHVEQLRRLAVGALTVDMAVPLERLEALTSPETRSRLVLPVDAALPGVPDVHLTALATQYLRQGQTVSARHAHAPGWVKLYDANDRFIGMGEVEDDGRVAPRRLLSID